MKGNFHVKIFSSVIFGALFIYGCSLVITSSDLSTVPPANSSAGSSANSSILNPISSTSAGSSSSINLSSSKAITYYAFAIANNGSTGIGSTDVIGTISGSNINFETLPSGANIASLVATFTDTGFSVTIGSTTQVSGVTTNSFTSPVTYTVTAADGSTASYIVSVQVYSPTNYFTFSGGMIFRFDSSRQSGGKSYIACRIL